MSSVCCESIVSGQVCRCVFGSCIELCGCIGVDPEVVSVSLCVLVNVCVLIIVCNYLHWIPLCLLGYIRVALETEMECVLALWGMCGDGVGVSLCPVCVPT